MEMTRNTLVWHIVKYLDSIDVKWVTKLMVRRAADSGTIVTCNGHFHKLRHWGGDTCT